MTSYAQKQRLERMREQPLYFIECVKSEKECIFKIVGSTKNIYTVKLTPKSLECNCPDALNYSRHNSKCKHSCFVWCKVLGLDESTLRDQSIKIFDDIKINDEICSKEMKEIYNKVLNSKVQTKFEMITKEIKVDDDCPVCFDTLADKNLRCNECPKCHNIIHERCMKKWLEFGNKTCPYCRSTVWGEITQTKDYINLG
jgi:Ring finger domain